MLKNPERLSNSKGRGLTILRSSSRGLCAFFRHQPLAWALPLQATLLLWNLDLLDPWGDEDFTLFTVPQPVGEIVSTVAKNIHPPLYYLLLHWWIQLPWGTGLAASTRAMSAAWAMLATVLVYALWLRGHEPRFQRRFLALWALSPCLLLHARMARSYSMQLAVAPLAVWAALRWVEQPADRRRLAVYVVANSVLLYTHYLSGLSVAAAVFLVLLARKGYQPAAAQAALMTLLYLPWMPTLVSALGNWASSQTPYEAGSLLVDQFVRLGYLFIAFAFGETFPAVGLVIAGSLTPVIIHALWKAAASRPAWLAVVLIACGFSWVGVSKFEPFVFGPTALFFALPFFLLLIVGRLNVATFAMLLVLYVCADYAYFARIGYLVKPYAAPNREMAEVIRAGSAGRSAVLAVDPFGSYSEPLIARLGEGVRVVHLVDEGIATDLLAFVRADNSRQTVIWVWRHTRDISPGAFITRFERDLGAGREVRVHEFVAYSAPERWFRRLLRGPGQPEFYYRLYEAR